MTADEGEIRTPYFNTQYPNNVDCAWTISKVTEENNLWLRFTEFDLEDSINCTADYVVIRDGKENNAKFIGNYKKKIIIKTTTTTTTTFPRFWNAWLLILDRTVGFEP